MGRYVNYTTVWNALDYPAAIFPVTTVDSTLDREGASMLPMTTSIRTFTIV
jgi:hypothetical protein